MTWPRNTELCAELGDKIRAGIQKPGSHNYLEVVRQGCLRFFPDPLSVGWVTGLFQVWLGLRLCVCMRAKSLQSCLTLCDLMDLSPPGSSVHGMLQARILEWVAVPSSRDLLDPGVKPVCCALQVNSLPLSHQGSPRRPRSFAPPPSTGQVSLLSLRCGTCQNLRPLSSDSRAFGKGDGMGKLQCRK